MPQPTRQQILDYVRTTAPQYGVPVDLALAQVWQESGGRATARSPAGAYGPMQLMPETARSLGVNPFDWQQNIHGGLKYMGQQLDKYGDPALALAAYNAGPGAVDKYGGVPPYKETQGYVRNILAKAQTGSVPTAPTRSVQMADNIPSYDDLIAAEQKSAPKPRSQTPVAPVAPVAPMVSGAAQSQSSEMPSYDELEAAAAKTAPSKVSPTPTQKAGPTMLDGVKRGAGIGTSSVIQGLTDLPLMLNDLALKYVQNPLAKAIGLPEAPMSMDVRDNLLNQVLPQPANPTERIVAGGVRQAAGVLTPAGVAGAVAKTAASPVVRSVAGSLAANPGAQMTAAGVGGAAGQGATELGYGPEASMAVNMAASLAAGIPAQRVANAASGNYTDSGRKAMALNEAARKQGVQLSAGDLGSRTAAAVENFIQDIPFTGRDSFMQQQAQQTKTMLERLRNQVGSGEPGREMIDTIRGAYDAKRAAAGQLYDAVKTELGKVPGSERVPVSQFSAEAKKFLKQYPKYLESSDVPQDVKNVLTAAANTNLKEVDYQTLRNLRTMVGGEVRAAQRAGKTISGDLSQLYKNLQSDFEGWANGLQKTNPDAAKAYGAADKFFKENVVPFKADSKIGKIVRSTTTDDELNILADGIMGSLFKAGNKNKADFALKLTGKPGEEIAQRELINRALEPSLDPRLKAGVSPMRFVNTLNMEDPMTAAVMGRNTGLMDQLGSINDIAQATRRSVSSFETPRTGVQNKMVGTVIGLANPMTTLPTAGGLLFGNAAQRALRTDAVKSLMFAQPGTANPYASAFPGLMPYLTTPGQ